MVDQAYLESIRKDFDKVATYLQSVSLKLQEKGYRYPIFVLSKKRAALGMHLFTKDTYGTTWHYHATYLELLIENNLIVKVEAFKGHYKDAHRYCCLLAVDPAGIHFLYIPYPKK